MTKAVFFDLDGTFADTAPDLAAALNYTRACRQLPPLPFEILRPQASHGSPGLLQAGFGITPESPEFNELREILLDYYTHNICVGTRLFDGMAEAPGEFGKQGVVGIERCNGENFCLI